jgi:hypothetical protein
MNRRSTTALLFGLILKSPPVKALPYVYTVPPGSPFQPTTSKSIQSESSSANFIGRARLFGEVWMGWESDGTGEDYIRAYLLPSQSSRKLLPLANDPLDPRRAPAPVRSVWLTNHEAFETQLLSGQDLVALKSRHVEAFVRTATIDVVNFQTSVDMDCRWYGTRIGALVGGGLAKLARKHPRELVCH